MQERLDGSASSTKRKKCESLGDTTSIPQVKIRPNIETLPSSSSQSSALNQPDCATMGASTLSTNQLRSEAQQGSINSGCDNAYMRPLNNHALEAIAQGAGGTIPQVSTQSEQNLYLPAALSAQPERLSTQHRAIGAQFQLPRSSLPFQHEDPSCVRVHAPWSATSFGPPHQIQMQELLLCQTLNNAGTSASQALHASPSTRAAPWNASCPLNGMNAPNFAMAATDHSLQPSGAPMIAVPGLGPISTHSYAMHHLIQQAPDYQLPPQQMAGNWLCRGNSIGPSLLTQSNSPLAPIPSLPGLLTPEQQLALLHSWQQMQHVHSPSKTQRLDGTTSIAGAPRTDGSASTTSGLTVSSNAVPMQAPSDKNQLSKYQILLREQLEYFVSHKDDAEYSVQGRKKQARLGQVGIRCKHCSHLPHRLRGRGAGYYPAKLAGVYQAAQNMATNHLIQFCTCIPSETREVLRALRGGRADSTVGGGKQYWADACVAIGLVEGCNGQGLRFHDGSDCDARSA